MIMHSALVIRVLQFLKIRSVYLLVNCVILLVGYLFILWGCVSSISTIKSSICISIGASLIASGIVLFLDVWRVLARDSIVSQVLRILVEAGVRNVYPKRDLDRYDLQMEKAQHVIDVAGYTLNAWYESYGDLVVEKTQKNKMLHVRILLVKPDSVFSIHRAELDGKSETSVKDSFERIKRKFAACSNIEMRMIDSILTTMVFRMDDNMYVGPHFYRKPSKGTLTLELESSGWLFKEYESEFNRMWNASSKVA
jgi:hypothetical protein